MWTKDYQHPIPLGWAIRASVAPCSLCQKTRGVLGITPLQNNTFEGIVEFHFARNGAHWYRISTGRLVCAKDVTDVKPIVS